eukprot:CAMPEP_0198732228 /NCGR_PEP_ID=MMETSP1475-20131203/34506_1 /TAXON_ID= ORGANISM="Unidentified sp., Strain CCMP1999" /NCGR_SAMPLE_ID=MMETSP1475 /ASSEMBLY_ACC=CAM_ASM_001111 /LENGTH=1783 /DNA_ID=CAMNT_0044495295 /DNA_START=53 /DNA_END=5401 /DNA_ORIENTATION=-
MPGEELQAARPALSFDRLRREVANAVGGNLRRRLDGSSEEVVDVIRAVHAHRSLLATPLVLYSADPQSQESRTKLENAGKDPVDILVITADGSYDEISVNLAPNFIAAAKSLAEDLGVNALDAAGLLYSARVFAAKRADKDVVAAARELFRTERRDQLLCLQELFRSQLADENDNNREVLPALLRERDLLVVSDVTTNLLKRLQEGISALAPGAKFQASKSLLDGEITLLAECVFLVCYTVQTSRGEAVLMRKCAATLAQKLTIAVQDAEGAGIRGDATTRQSTELNSASHLLFLAWACALDRSRYRDSYDARTDTMNVNRLLRDEGFIRESAEEQVPALAPHELVACLFRLATANPDEESDAVKGPLRVCIGDRRALQYISEELPAWLSHGKAVLSQDIDLYYDALEDLAIDIAEAPTLCSVLIDFTQEAANAAAASLLGDTEVEVQLDSAVQATSGCNFVKNLATLFASAIRPAKMKVAATRSVYGGLRYLSGPNGGGGVLQRLGDAVIDLGDTAMRDPDAPGGIGRLFTDALVAFLDFMKSCACVSVPYAAAIARYLAEAGHPMASLERLQAAVSYYTQALQGDSGAELNPAESKVLTGLIEVTGECASTLYRHGDFLTLVGADFPMKLAAMAVLELSPSLKASAIRTIRAFRDRTGISAFLECATADQCAGLSKELNSVEAARGSYLVTVETMKLCTEILRDLDMLSDSSSSGLGRISRPPPEVEAVVMFVLDDVLSLWNRRHYKGAAERWHVAAAATEMTVAAKSLERMIGRLLLPAPGSGGPASALRALAAIAGLQATVTFDENASGIELINDATARGDGICVRYAETAATNAAMTLEFLVNISPSRLRKASVAAVSAGELLVSEYKSVISAASIMGANISASAAAAAYIAALVSSTPAMASRITGDSIASGLRTSLALVVSGADGDQDIGVSDEDGVSTKSVPPLFDSIIQLMTACFTRDGASSAGFYLLGISSEGDGSVEDYGILAGLCERIRYTTRLDDRKAAEAASFLSFLASNSRAGTAFATLEFIRNEAGGSCAAETLTRIYTEVEPDTQEEVDWLYLARLLTACLRITALESRLYPPENNSEETVSARGHALLEVLMIVARLARDESTLAVVPAAFGAWRQLLWTSATRFQQEGRLTVATLYEIVGEILDGLAGTTDSDMEHMVFSDGASSAASVALLCISILREPLPDGVQLDISQAASLLDRLLRAICGPLSARPDGANARTALYAALLHAVQIVEGLARRDDTADIFDARAKGGDRSGSIYAKIMEARVGRRQWSVAEGLIAIASTDALSGFPATRSAAMNAISCTLRMDAEGAAVNAPTATALAALSAQNRLRKISGAAIADPNAVSQIAQLGRVMSTTGGDSNTHQAAALFVAESALLLLHSVASIPGGARLLTDAGAVENAAYLASALSTGSAIDSRSIQRGGDRSMDAGLGARHSFAQAEAQELGHTGEIRATLAGSIAGVAAASLRRRGPGSQPDTAVATPALGVIESGQLLFAELSRDLKDTSIVRLNATASIALVLSRLPEGLIDVGAASFLANVLSHELSALFHSKKERMWSGGVPRNAREARRAQVSHPEGGSLFERDLARARMACARAGFAAIRSSSSLLNYYSPTAVSSSEGIVHAAKPTVGDLLGIISISLNEMKLAAEEEMRIKADVANFAKRPQSLRAFCLEEFGTAGSNLNSTTLEQCLLKTARQSRTYAERECAAVIETVLYIVREYTRAARETSTFDDPKVLHIDGRNSLLAVCRDVESIPPAVWGRRDP